MDRKTFIARLGLGTAGLAISPLQGLGKTKKRIITLCFGNGIPAPIYSMCKAAGVRSVTLRAFTDPSDGIDEYETIDLTHKVKYRLYKGIPFIKGEPVNKNYSYRLSQIIADETEKRKPEFIGLLQNYSHVIIIANLGEPIGYGAHLCKYSRECSYY